MPSRVYSRSAFSLTVGKCIEMLSLTDKINDKLNNVS